LPVLSTSGSLDLKIGTIIISNISTTITNTTVIITRPKIKRPPKIQEWEKEEYSGIDHLYAKTDENEEVFADSDVDVADSFNPSQQSGGTSKRKSKRDKPPAPDSKSSSSLKNK
jgi:hypothetical protein